MSAPKHAQILLGILLLQAGAAMAQLATLQGTAFYRERIALEPGAILEVELLDISPAGPPSQTLASIRIKVQEQVPIPFQLHYDPTMIEPSRIYSVTAKLIREGVVTFRSDSLHPVLTRGAGDKVDILMVRVGAPYGTSPEKGSAEVTEEDSTGLIGPVWVAEDIDSRGVIDRLQSHITFTADGQVRGSGGCNSFSGEYKLKGGQLSFGPLASTMMACPEPIMDQETRFHGALSRARSFRIEKGLLHLLDAEGASIIRLWARD